MLLTKYQLNKTLELQNRIVMAPMTRAATAADGVPTAEMVAYYARRAEAGLIITEGTLISEIAGGHGGVPGLFTEAQIAGWRAVTEAVHAQGGLIFSQIWHVGRVSHPDFLHGILPVGPSVSEMTGPINRARHLSFGQCRALLRDEINELIAQYAQAASHAIAAGFDGVELHGANGYLIDQFLHYDTNHREDEYGKTPENLARFALDIVRACIDAIGYERLSLRLSPGAYLNQINGDARDAMVFRYLLEKLSNMGLAYVHTGNFDDARRFPELEAKTMTEFMRQHYRGTLISCGGHSPSTALKAIQANEFDLLALGRPFIANPDLIARLKTGAPLKAYDVSMLNTLY
jgi:N-ethylmaleimide reductase